MCTCRYLRRKFCFISLFFASHPMLAFYVIVPSVYSSLSWISILYLPLETGDILVTAVLIHLQDYAGLVEGPNHVYCQDQPKYLAFSQLFILFIGITSQTSPPPPTLIKVRKRAFPASAKNCNVVRLGTECKKGQSPEIFFLSALES